MEGSSQSQTGKTKLPWILCMVFLFALLMGPGPGLYLINGYALSGGTVWGVPALYAWAVFWFLVEAGIIVTAYFKLWRVDTA